MGGYQYGSIKMIHVERGRAPTYYKERSAKATAILKSQLHRASSQELPHFDDRIWRLVRDYFGERFYEKCAYCETRLMRSTGNIVQYRPKSIYPWLAYDWDNLLLACAGCNASQGMRFPLEDERQRAKAPAQLVQEIPLILDPCSDWPEEHLVFSDNGQVYSDTKRGLVTIDALALNRPSLAKARRDRAQWLLSLLPGGETLLAGETKSLLRIALGVIRDSEPYAAMSRQVIKRVLESRGIPYKMIVAGDPEQAQVARQLGKIIPKNVRKVATNYTQHEQNIERFSLSDSQSPEPTVNYFAKRRSIDRVVVENFKVIRRLDIQLAKAPEDQSSWMMFLGENGTGKSSLLKAIALTIMGQEQRQQVHQEHRVTPDDVLSHGAEHGRVRVWLTGVSKPLELAYRRGQSQFSGTNDDKVLLLGYGSTRLLPRPEMPDKGGTGPVRVANLFNPVARLVDAEQWLAALPKKYFDPVAAILKKLLPLRPRDQLRVVVRDGKRHVVVRMSGDEASLSELSDGFQGVLSLTVDILSVLLPYWKERVQFAEGIVLIDELDAHLHPSWRKRIVSDLRACFPNVQFFATTHDPLCLQGLKQGEVTALKRGTRRRVIAVRDLPSPEGMTADQLLTSEHFGLESVMSNDASDRLKEYYRLLALPRRSRADSEKLQQVKLNLKRLHYLGQTRREQMMLEAIDDYLSTVPPADEQAQRARRVTVEAKLRSIYASDLRGRVSTGHRERGAGSRRKSKRMKL